MALLSSSARWLRIDPAMVGIALVDAALDQATKAWIRSTLGSGGPRSIEVVGDWVRLTYTTNSGAAFGILPSGTLFFTLVAIIAVPILLAARWYLPPRWWGSVLFGLLLGGTLGNLIDRIRLGRVTDFIDVGVGSVRWPAFNIADSSFVVGVLILAAIFILVPDGPDEATDDARVI